MTAKVLCHFITLKTSFFCDFLCVSVSLWYKVTA